MFDLKLRYEKYYLPKEQYKSVREQLTKNATMRLNNKGDIKVYLFHNEEMNTTATVYLPQRKKKGSTFITIRYNQKPHLKDLETILKGLKQYENIIFS